MQVELPSYITAAAVHHLDLAANKAASCSPSNAVLPAAGAAGVPAHPGMDADMLLAPTDATTPRSSGTAQQPGTEPLQRAHEHHMGMADDGLQTDHASSKEPLRPSSRNLERAGTPALQMPPGLADACGAEDLDMHDGLQDAPVSAEDAQPHEQSRPSLVRSPSVKVICLGLSCRPCGQHIHVCFASSAGLQ